MKMTDFDLDETYEAKVCAMKCAWQEAEEAVNAQRDTIEGAKVQCQSTCLLMLKLQTQIDCLYMMRCNVLVVFLLLESVVFDSKCFK